MMRLFLDANILFSAALTPDGRAARLIELGGELGFELVSSDYAVNEAIANLQRKYPAALSRLAGLLPQLRLMTWSAPEPCPIPLRDKDRPILAAAIEGRCHALITGDVRDFGKFMNQPGKTGGVAVCTLAQFLEMK
jgi:predicted nucleic acid-binding protein